MPDAVVAAHERGVKAAVAAGWAVLSRGGPAAEAVEAAVSVMEDDDTFDAGRGAFLTRDGRVQLDALLMNGADLRAGGVACVERLRNPIQAARLVLHESPHVYFVGEGAEQFAAEHGMALIKNSELIVERERERLRIFLEAEAAGEADTTFSGLPAEFGVPHSSRQKLRDEWATRPHSVGVEAALDAEVEEGLPAVLRLDDPTLHSHDTVGAVALDADGNLAAGTSTGGTLGKAPGRVGDSSLIGCGCYADNGSAAVSLTGWGEPIMKLVLGKWAADRVAAGSAPEQASAEAIAYLHQRLGGHGGMILLDRDGRIGLAHNTPRMAWGVATAAGQQVGAER